MNKSHPPAADLSPPASMAGMGVLLQNAGIRLSPFHLRQLWAYHTLLRDRNPELNLTRVHRFSGMVMKLYLDSLLPAVMIDLPSPLLDLGTGPGMPGIPIKIFRPDLEVILAESRGKRVAFLNRAIERLELKGIRVHAGRISAHTEIPVNGVITRAVEPIGETLARIQNVLRQNGAAIFMKGPGCDAEVEQAIKRFRDRYRLLSDKPYLLSGTRHRRRLVVFERRDAPAYAVRESARSLKTLHVISSPRNPLFIDLKKLLTGRGIRKTGKALVSGTRLVTEILQTHPNQCAAWVSRGEQDPPPPGAPGSLKWYCLAPPLFEALDIFGTHSPLLVIRVPEMPVWNPEEDFPPGCTVILPFQDPENVGAAIRSAAAFGASRVVLLKESAHPFHPKALRASGGTVLALPLWQGPPLDTIPSEIPILALSPKGRPLNTVHFPKAFGLLVGLEGPGLPSAWEKRAVSIPMAGKVESLNAAAALSVVLYEWSRGREHR